MVGRVSIINAGPMGPPGPASSSLIDGGTATVPSGSTSIVVSHDVGSAPNIYEIMITPTNNLGDATTYWVSGVTSTEFVINVDVNPGVTTATFAWGILRI